MNKIVVCKKRYILISIFLISILGVIVLFNEISRENENGNMYAIIHMNATATLGLKMSDLYKESGSFPHKFSLSEKSKDIEQWDIEIVTDNKFLNEQKDLKIYVKNKKDFIKTFNYILKNEYLGNREFEEKNGKESEEQRYSVLKIPFKYRKFKNPHKNYLDISYENADFIYGLNTKVLCREYINQNI
ncbi:MAG: hypothetical protein ACRCYE_06085 [Sarcina sp.]